MLGGLDSFDRVQGSSSFPYDSYYLIYSLIREKVNFQLSLAARSTEYDSEAALKSSNSACAFLVVTTSNPSDFGHDIFCGFLLEYPIRLGLSATVTDRQFPFQG